MYQHMRLHYRYNSQSEPKCCYSYVNADIYTYGKVNGNAYCQSYVYKDADRYADVDAANEWPVLLQHTVNK